MADSFIHVRTTPSLKADFMRAVNEHPDLETPTHFIKEAIKALVLQTRRGEMPAFPLEFVCKIRAETVAGLAPGVLELAAKATQKRGRGKQSSPPAP